MAQQGTTRCTVGPESDDDVPLPPSRIRIMALGMGSSANRRLSALMTVDFSAGDTDSSGGGYAGASGGKSPSAKSLARKLTVATLNPDMVNMEYAVRGGVVIKAAEMKERLQKGEDVGFTEIIPCNIGNPHAVQQKPITFYRQVLSV